MGKTKMVFRRFPYWACDDFAQYLEDMALKGLEFKCFTGYGMKFEKTEPQKQYYHVEIFPKGKERDWGPSQDTLEYLQYCEAAGYEFVDSMAKMCVFRRNSEKTIQMYSEEERYKNIRKTIRNQMIWLAIVFAVLWFINAPLSPFNNGEFAQSFFNGNCYLDMAYDVLLLSLFGTHVGAFLFTGRCYKKSLTGDSTEGAYYGFGRNRRGKFPFFDKLEWISVVGVIVFVLSFLLRRNGFPGDVYLFLAFMAIYFFFILINQLIAGKVRPTGDNATLFAIVGALISGVLVFFILTMASENPLVEKILTRSYSEEDHELKSDENCQLKWTDICLDSAKLKEVTFSSGWVENEKTFFGSYHYYDTRYVTDEYEKLSEEENQEDFEYTDEWEERIRHSIFSLEYTVYETKYSWLRDLKWQELMKKAERVENVFGFSYDGTLEKAKGDWGTSEAWIVKTQEAESGCEFYYLKYDDKIIKLSYEEPYTQEQIEIIRQKLGVD